MRKNYLPSQWTLKGKGISEMPAEVPGCVHTDLQRNGLLPDFYWRDNAKQLQWVENEDWTYYCHFDAECSERAELVFEGLDTYCDVFLNGELVGCADNMFIAHTFNVTGRLREKGNELEVRFRSPVREVEGLPRREAAFLNYERLYSRRMQCTYGWDWVERFVTCGIYRPVYLHYGADMHADSVYIVTENIDAFSAQLYVEIHFKNYRQGALVHMAIEAPDGETVYAESLCCREETVVRRVDIAQPQLWYPNGYGAQPLYRLRVTVLENELTEIFGIRTLKILQLPDEKGSEYERIAREAQQGDVGRVQDYNEITAGFQVIVNGIPVLCKGANWVPCEPFPSAETEEKYTHLLSLAQEMHVNMLRVWGGGIFESRYFYEQCDRLGILVTQDFLMACGSYPEKDPAFLEQLRLEAAYAAKTLRNHPCLAWWSGDNENAVGGNDQTWDFTGRDAALRGLAPEVYRYDPRRPFLPSSPYGGNTYGSITRGTTHNTNYLGQMWDYFENSDCADYKAFLERYFARFIAEEPTFGAACLPSLLRFMEEQDVFGEDETILRYHTKNNPYFDRAYMDYVTHFTQKTLGTFADGKDRLFKYTYIQYEWMRVVFENMRRRIGYCNGLIFWMFNDCWPAALGWSIVDYYGLPKAAYYSFKRCAKPLVSSVTCENNAYTVVLSHEGQQPLDVTCRISQWNMADMTQAEKAYEFTAQVEAYAAVSTPLPWEVQTDRLIVCDILDSGYEDRSFYKEGTLSLERADHALQILRRNKDSITLKTDQYLHVVALEGNCVFSDNYFSMMPGEVRTVSFNSLCATFASDIAVEAYTFRAEGDPSFR